MQAKVSIEISKPKESVWAAITDIENCADMLSSILNIEVLEQPPQSLIGLKWQETRKMFGKEATETMWITEAVENEYYCTRAESHGAIYISKLSLVQTGESTLLTMSFTGQAQTFIAKVMSAIMSPMIKNSMNKELQKDLNDIKKHVESSDKN